MPEVPAVRDASVTDDDTWHVAASHGGCPVATSADAATQTREIDTTMPNWKIEEELLNEEYELCDGCFPFPPEDEG